MRQKLKRFKVLVFALVLAAVLAACSTTTHTTFHPLSGTGSANIPGVNATTEAQAKTLVAKCLPKSETAQLKLLEPTKGKPARVTVEDCFAIPQAQRTAFDDAFLNAALKAHLNTKAGRDAFPNTVAVLVVKYGG